MDGRTLDELEAARAPFLQRLPTTYQGVACNYFLEPPRHQGATDALTTLKLATANIRRRQQTAEAYRAFSASSERSAEHLAQLVQAIEDDPEGALWLAAWAVAYVQLPESDRRSRKTAKATNWAQESMRGKPPTAKQLAYLDRLGYQGVVTDRQHASALIDEQTRKAHP
jgi:hypothetical protein